MSHKSSLSVYTMPVHSHQRKKRRYSHNIRTMGDHEEFLQRITKTLYYSKLPATERFSLPLSELAVELYSEVKLGRSLERLQIDDSSEISRNACISPCSLVLAVIYLEQLKNSNSAYVDKVAPSELFLISLMVASKFLNDNGEEDDVLNSEWATSANLSLSELNKLEKEFLNAIEWKVFVKEEEFWKKLRSLETKVALSEGKKRGWFSYSELEALLDQLNAYILAQTVFTVSAVCLASYAASMLTVIGSTIVATQLVYAPSQALIGLRQDFSFPIQENSYSSLTYNDELEFENDTTIECCDKMPWLEKLIIPHMTTKIRLDKGFMNENVSEFYGKLSVPTYYLTDFQRHWKQPALYLISK